MTINTTSSKIEIEFNRLVSTAPSTNTSRQAVIDRLVNALNFVAEKRPGAKAVQARQAAILLALKGVDLIPDQPDWRGPIVGLRRNPYSSSRVRARELRAEYRPRSDRFSAAERVMRRARATGDYKFALDLANAYHRRIKSLATSERAEASWGRGGQEQSADIYAKSYTVYGGGRGFHPLAHWKNYGARVEYPQGEAAAVVLETARGTEIARIPLPTKAERAHIVLTHPGLLDGDLWGRLRGGSALLVRYGLRKGAVVKLGYAVEATQFDGSQYWEHGATLRAVLAEIAHKHEIDRERAHRERIAAPERRMARLIARLCPGLICTYADARSLGFCDSGIRGFAERHGIPTDQATASGLRATGSREAVRVIDAAARRVAAEALAARAAR